MDVLTRHEVQRPQVQGKLRGRLLPGRFAHQKIHHPLCLPPVNLVTRRSDRQSLPDGGKEHEPRCRAHPRRGARSCRPPGCGSQRPRAAQCLPGPLAATEPPPHRPPADRGAATAWNPAPRPLTRTVPGRPSPPGPPCGPVPALSRSGAAGGSAPGVEAGAAGHRVERPDGIDGVAAGVDRHVNGDVEQVARSDARGVRGGSVAPAPANPAVLRNGRAKAMRFTTPAALCEVLDHRPVTCCDGESRATPRVAASPRVVITPLTDAMSSYG